MGGVSQRGTFCFTVKGEGCTFGQAGWEQRLYDFFLPLQGKVTRIDLARDFFVMANTGSMCAYEAYRNDEFYRGQTIVR